VSVHFLFVLLGILELSLAETLTIGCLAVLVQCLWKTKHKPHPIQVLFSFCSTSIAVFATYVTCHLPARFFGNSLPLLLIISALTYFVSNTMPVAVVISLCEDKPLRRIWSETYFWSLSFYLIGAAIVGVVHYSMRFIGWQSAMLVVPIMYWIYRSYHLYLGRLEDENGE